MDGIVLITAVFTVFTGIHSIIHIMDHIMDLIMADIGAAVLITAMELLLTTDLREKSGSINPEVPDCHPGAWAL